jgi:hypothetical protein
MSLYPYFLDHERWEEEALGRDLIIMCHNVQCATSFPHHNVQCATSHTCALCCMSISTTRDAERGAEWWQAILFTPARL